MKDAPLTFEEIAAFEAIFQGSINVAPEHDTERDAPLPPGVFSVREVRAWLQRARPLAQSDRDQPCPKAPDGGSCAHDIGSTRCFWCGRESPNIQSVLEGRNPGRFRLNPAAGERLDIGLRELVGELVDVYRDDELVHACFYRAASNGSTRVEALVATIRAMAQRHKEVMRKISEGLQSAPAILFGGGGSGHGIPASSTAQGLGCQHLRWTNGRCAGCGIAWADLK